MTQLERGFTYREDDAPLDMRMDQRNEQTAKDIVNTYSEMELYRIIRDYGEDRFAKNIAKHIVQARQKKEIETTGELTEIIRASIPAKGPGDRRSSGKAYVSGDPDRVKPGTGCAGRFDRYDD